eukprot:TRINITY_DN22565_c1_g1_i1.p1 TRINITY_DN22565_c1_g1~~TRINITY_DN22565_c1_g1_i1.p1  ORF type:complete len:498 (-),score=86.38 TRINITY_DN22565_c1_g1_i1:69-1523(-)
MADESDDDIAKALEIIRERAASQAAPAVLEHDMTSFDLNSLEHYPPVDAVQPTRHEPVGPNWKKPGKLVQLPKIAGTSQNCWLIHERQDANGRYKAWLFFDVTTGMYYRLAESSSGPASYTLIPTPHEPRQLPITVRLGSACVLGEGASGGSGAKLDMAVLMPELHKTGFLLKQPLEFLDRPASLLLLCAGLRNTSAASDFCARRLHTVVLPKLSSRTAQWSGAELADVLKIAVKELDALLLEAPACLAGCSLAVALLAGSYLAVGALGGVRCLLCGPYVAVASPAWSARQLAGGPVGHTLENAEEALRVASAAATCGGGTPSSSSSVESRVRVRSAGPAMLATISDEWEREVVRVCYATNPFAVLGLSVAELREGAAAIRRTFRRRSLVVHPDKVSEARRDRTRAVFSKLEAAVTAVETMLQGRLAADPSAAMALLGISAGWTARPSLWKKAAETLGTEAQTALLARFSSRAALTCCSGVIRR